MSRSKVTVICVIAGSTSVAPMAGEVATMRGGAVGSNDGGSEDLLAAGEAVAGSTLAVLPFPYLFPGIIFPNKSQSIACNLDRKFECVAYQVGSVLIGILYGFQILIVLQAIGATMMENNDACLRVGLRHGPVRAGEGL